MYRWNLIMLTITFKYLIVINIAIDRRTDEHEKNTYFDNNYDGNKDIKTKDDIDNDDTGKITKMRTYN